MTDVRRAQDSQAFGVRRHNSVLNPVVDHLDEVPCTAWAAMQVTELSGAAMFFSSWSTRDGIAARSEGRENRIEVCDRVGLAANHQAIASFEPSDATACSHVNVVNPFRLEFC